MIIRVNIIYSVYKDTLISTMCIVVLLKLILVIILSYICYVCSLYGIICFGIYLIGMQILGDAPQHDCVWYGM